MIRRILPLFVLLISGGFVIAQNQYVSDLNYRTMQLTPVAHTPGVSWVYEDNSAFDANHQRYFFQGGTNPQGPWSLYAIDVVSGTVLSSAMVPSNNSEGAISGLQYDNGVDTLYATYYDGLGNVYLSWVEIATGVVHPKQPISALSSYSGSTYDSKDHLYIVYGGDQLISIDARTGYVVYNSTFSLNGNVNASELVYDNVNSTLFGIYAPGNGAASFDSISLSSGKLHYMCTLAVRNVPQINAYTIDEAGGAYLFAGTLPMANGCVHYQLYVISLSLAKVVDSAAYAYAENPGDPVDSNLLEFSFDQRRAQLYALNWRPSLQTIPPVFNITQATNPACTGRAEVFNAVLSSPTYVANSYQWQVNGQPTGSSMPMYTDSVPLNGDSIRCILTLSTGCNSFLADTSAAIVLTVLPAPASSIRITSSGDNICSGDTVGFTADGVNGGNAPQFQWLINGVPAAATGGTGSTGATSVTFSSAALADGDTVRCVMSGSLTCSVPDTSGPVVMSVRPSPSLVMPPDTVIARGQSVPLTPSIQGTIASYQWQPTAGLTSAGIADPVATPANTTTYTLDVIAGNGCAAAGEVTIKVSTRLYMPGAFTPNGDGHNDVFRIPPSVGVQLIRLSVFNRWGQRMFETADPSQGWDGTSDGKLAPAGAYIWVLEYVDGLTGQRQTARGTVVLVR